MPSVEEIIEALRPVEDPELHRSIVDLQMVRDVSISGSVVDVVIVLTVAGCPMKAEIEKRVTSALMPLDGVESVRIELTVMSPEQLEAVRTQMQSSDGGHGHTHGPSAFATSAVRVIMVTSGKGGVGKSTVAANLAVSLAKQGLRTGLLDADVYGFSIPDILGVDEEPQLEGDRIVPPIAQGVSVMSIGYFVEPGKPVMWRGPMLHKAVEQFLGDVEWGELDFLIVDTPPGTGDVAMSLAKQLPRAETLVVTTPQPAAQTVAFRSGAMAKEIGMSILGVVENMAYFEDSSGKSVEIFGAGGGSILANDLDSSVLAQIPIDVGLREAGDDGTSIAGTSTADIFTSLAKTIRGMGPRRIYKPELKVQ